jgi:hypothetical protein
MRTIRYRGLRKDNPTIWVYGFYVTSSIEHHAGERHFIVCGDNPSLYAGREFIEVLPESVGQWTGLDLDDKEVYENDILKGGNGKLWVIIFKKYGWWVCNEKIADRMSHKFAGAESYPLLQYLNMSMESGIKMATVIGSIHTHPELIKEKV